MANADTTPSPSTSSSSSSPPSWREHFFTPRARRQLTLFFGGACFMAGASLITRRALQRRYRLVRPSFYQPSHAAASSFTAPAAIDGPMEAFEALNIATVYLLSTSFMLTTGTLWALDISTLDELRRVLRAGMGVDDDPARLADADRQIEEWVAGVLARKGEREKLKGTKLKGMRRRRGKREEEEEEEQEEDG
ncbi:MAG: hypothetical protein M1826_006655 [Phylliscum demangeonii]|nr:MAG: hypothetical protein M1826_006655 [Phylliscum demangeonii]